MKIDKTEREFRETMREAGFDSMATAGLIAALDLTFAEESEGEGLGRVRMEERESEREEIRWTDEETGNWSASEGGIAPPRKGRDGLRLSFDGEYALARHIRSQEERIRELEGELEVSESIRKTQAVTIGEYQEEVRELEERGKRDSEYRTRVDHPMEELTDVLPHLPDNIPDEEVLRVAKERIRELDEEVEDWKRRYIHLEAAGREVLEPLRSALRRERNEARERIRELEGELEDLRTYAREQEDQAAEATRQLNEYEEADDEHEEALRSALRRAVGWAKDEGSRSGGWLWRERVRELEAVLDGEGEEAPLDPEENKLHGWELVDHPFFGARDPRGYVHPLPPTPSIPGDPATPTPTPEGGGRWEVETKVEDEVWIRRDGKAVVDLSLAELTPDEKSALDALVRDANRGGQTDYVRRLEREVRELAEWKADHLSAPTPSRVTREELAIALDNMEPGAKHWNTGLEHVREEGRAMAEVAAKVLGVPLWEGEGEEEALKPCPNPECGREVVTTEAHEHEWYANCLGCCYRAPVSETEAGAIRLHNLIALLGDQE